MSASHTYLSFTEVCAISALLLPLVSFLISILISEHYSWIASIVAPFILLLSTVAAGIVLFTHWNEPSHIINIEWFSLNANTFSANLELSNQSGLMLFVVSAISFLVHVYSIGYMAGDRNVIRYFAMLGFFTFAMQGIVLSDNLLLTFVFWELVGFSSYLLIGHYVEKPEAGRASKKAFIMNRIGDAGFIVGLMILWTQAHTFEISQVVSTGEAFKWQTAAALCIFCGVIGKSAQFPLFTWLPDAMEGPTPVSALIHAATMVAAGVYLMIRLFGLFTEPALAVVAITGAVTAILAALAALSQYDIKKILAYSTISQLGLMIMALGLGVVNAALLHLFTHAFFKACLFLCAGSVIHALHQGQQQLHIHFDNQDIRNMGGLFKKLPFTTITFVIGAASLAGVPFFSGFLSKDAILTAVWTHSNMLSWIMLASILSVSFLTVVYTFRVTWFIFFGEARNVKNLPITETALVMRAPMILLATCSLWIVVSWNPFDFTGWMLPALPHTTSAWITIISGGWVLLALGLSYRVFKSGKILSNPLSRNAFYVDSLLTNFFRKGVMPLATLAQYSDRRIIDRAIHLTAYGQVTFAHVVGWVDRKIVDGLVHLAAYLVSGVGRFARTFQGGKIQLYIFWAAFAIIIFLICAL